MSGGVFNITVDGCIFGSDNSDFAGIHIKTTRGRGGAVHGLDFRNNQFMMTTSTKMQMPFSAAMFYGGGDLPLGNKSSTPEVHDVHFSNSAVHLMAKQPSKSKPTWSFVGLNESHMRNFVFENITIVNGAQNGWSCKYTEGFVFKNVSHPPSASSGCATPARPEPEPSSEPGFQLLGKDGTCRDSNGLYPAWGGANAPNSQCKSMCANGANCDAYMSTSNGLYCQFFCTSGVGGLCSERGNGGGLPSTTDHNDSDRYCWLKQK
jgi:hypothetical protein